MSPITVEGAAIDQASNADYADPMAKKTNEEAPSRTGRKGQASKTQILESAIDLLGEGGYGALSISAVCKRAGVAPTSIYWHFGDKEGLMAAMVKYSLRREFDNFMAAFEQKRSKELLIDAYFSVFRAQIVSDKPSCWAVISTLAEGRREAPAVAALVNEARRKQLYFAETWGVAVAGVSNPAAFAHMIVGFNTFAANVWQQSRSEEEVDGILDAMREMMLLFGEPRLKMVADDAAFRECMAKWGYEP